MVLLDEARGFAYQLPCCCRAVLHDIWSWFPLPPGPAPRIFHHSQHSLLPRPPFVRRANQVRDFRSRGAASAPAVVYAGAASSPRLVVRVRSERSEKPFAIKAAVGGSFFGMGVEIACGAEVFQADDEGSIPFTRSTLKINDLGNNL